MPYIIGVKFRNVGKVYYFDPVDYTVRYHDHVIVETARGIEYGTVVLTKTEIAPEKLQGPLKPVIRMATEEDTAREEMNREKEKEAYRICKQKIAEHGLDMKLIEAEYTFDGSKVLFYFTAEGRIDFRELVKDLAGIFRMRIELRQIGVRDETKILGGIGSCGRALCCHTWLTDFAPVSIKMAKDQNLSLNPSKISGTCGRLMCCLKNEADTYAALSRNLPGKGDHVTTQDGLEGIVQSVNILRQTVRVIVENSDGEKELHDYAVEDISFVPKGRKAKHQEEHRGGQKEKEKAQKPAKEASGPDAEQRKQMGGGQPSKKNRRRQKPSHEAAYGEQEQTGRKEQQPAARREQQETSSPQEEMQEKKHRRRRRHPKGARQEAGKAAPAQTEGGGKQE